MRVQARGLDKALRRIEEIRGRVENLQPALEVVGEMVVAETKLSFREEASPDGTKWAPLSDVTILRRVTRTKGGHSIRRAQTKSGRATKRAIKAFTGGARIGYDRGQFFQGINSQATARTMRFGSPAVQAATFHFGRKDNLMFKKWPAPIPSRPVFPVTTDRPAKLMTTGRGGAMWVRARALLHGYVLTGRIQRG